MDIEQMKRDRAKGTPGPWELRFERGSTMLYMIEHPDAPVQMCDETYYPWCPDNLADWARIARVPEMEARIIELEAELAEARSKIYILREFYTLREY